METPDIAIPDRIVEGEQYFLNCEVGESVNPGDLNDKYVLDRLEVTFSDSFLQIYYRYPNTGPNDSQKYIDVVALSPLFGAVIIEVLPYEIDDIEKIEGPDWSISGESVPIRPISVAGDALLGIRRQFENREELCDSKRQSIVSVRDYVAVPNISRSEWSDRFDEDIIDRLLFEDTLENRDTLWEMFSDGRDDPLSDKVTRDALAALKFSDSISGGQLNVEAQPKTRRDLLGLINQRLKILTDKQMKIGLQSPDTPQQIRGIAGSGKTVVTALRAAKLHWLHEDWNIVVTFRNHGLRQTHERLITSFYHQFSNGDDPNWEKLEVLHDWGGKTTGPGMYSRLATAADTSPLSVNEARASFGQLNGTRLLNRCCRDLHTSGDIPSIFDAIIIDEAQDLPDYFFRMCYDAAKSEKRIYWAYDEAQNLATLEANSPEELFGRDQNGEPLVNVSRMLPGGVNGTHVMRTAFRTPRSVLMTGHGFGMGMYRDGPLVQTITNVRGWDRLGYQVTDGDFTQPGSRVTIKRPLQYSPNPLSDYQRPHDLLRIRWKDSWEDEVELIANDVSSFVNNEDVLPEEIMIIYLWPYDVREERIELLISQLDSKINFPDPGQKTVVNNVGESVSKKGSSAVFRLPNQISLSGVHHARGNEAPMVYVLGMETVAEQTAKELVRGKERNWRQQHVKERNRAFVAFSRTQGWLTVSGTDPTNRIAGELNRVLGDTRTRDPKLTFCVPEDDSPFKEMEPEDFNEGNQSFFEEDW